MNSINKVKINLDTEIDYFLQTGYQDNPEWMRVIVDADDKILCGIKSDGTFSALGGIEGLDEKLQETVYELLQMIEDAEATIDEKLEIFNSVFSVVDNPEWIQVTTDSDGKILEGITTEGKKMVMIETTFENKTIGEIASEEFENKSTLDKFSENNQKLLWNGEPIASETSISTLVVDLTVSDGTDVSSGYAYIDSTNRTIKVKA